MNESIREEVFERTVQAISDALDNDGNPLNEAQAIHDGIIAGYNDALNACGVPEEYHAKLRLI